MDDKMETTGSTGWNHNLSIGDLTSFNRQDFNEILVVDDEPAIREVIRDYLSMEGYLVLTAADGVEALDVMRRKEFDVVVTDLSMPNMDGFGLMKEALKIQPFTSIIVLSGQGTFENAIEAVHRGAYDFVAKPVRDFKSFKITVDRGLEHKSLLVNRENYQRNLESMVEEQTQELGRTNRLLQQYAEQLETSSLAFITTLLSALEDKDRYTAGHSRRVTYYAVGVARCMGIKGHDLWILQTAGQLHDMGKLMVDLSYVNKPGPLTPDEWEIMKEHPAMADRFLAPLSFLEEVRPIIRSHHERMDGSGYPDGLQDGEVGLLTQILAVADSYDAMTSHRSYRDPMPSQDAMVELRRFSDLQFKSEVVESLAEFVAGDGADIQKLADKGKTGLEITTPWFVGR